MWLHPLWKPHNKSYRQSGNTIAECGDVKCSTNFLITLSGVEILPISSLITIRNKLRRCCFTKSNIRAQTIARGWSKKRTYWFFRQLSSLRCFISGMEIQARFGMNTHSQFLPSNSSPALNSSVRKLNHPFLKERGGKDLCVAKFLRKCITLKVVVSLQYLGILETVSSSSQ